MSDPKIEIVRAEGDRHKLTISPSERRVTVKLASDADDAECWRVERFFMEIYDLAGFAWPVTMRGRMGIGESSITLWNDGRTVSSRFERDGELIFQERGSK